jgi:hypothetical protein
LASQIRFTPDVPLRKLGKLDRRVRAGISKTMEFWDGRIETHMKHHAPWTDRTTNARNGLAAEAFEDGNNFGIVLRHSVSYGIYLEDPYNGYAIIEPTIDAYAPKVMKTLTKLIDRLKG